LGLPTGPKIAVRVMAGKILKKDPKGDDVSQRAEGSLLLVNKETSKQKDWWNERVIESVEQNKKIAEELRNLDYKSEKEKKRWFRKADVLERCGKGKNLFIDNSNGCFVEFHKRCKSRVCLICMLIRSLQCFDQFFPILLQKKIPRKYNHRGLRFLTLTLENQKDLTEGINQIYSAFTKFKRRKYFKEMKDKKSKRISGGVGVFHIKKGKENKELYNLHIHLIIDSGFLDMKSHKKTGGDSELVKEWKACTGGSGVLDIRMIGNKSSFCLTEQEGALRYLLGYMGLGLKELTPKEKAIVLKETSGRRLLFTFGEFYNLHSEIKKPKNNRFQYVPPHSMEYELYLDSKYPKKRPVSLEDF
jgi:hypothetical protein